MQQDILDNEEEDIKAGKIRLMQEKIQEFKQERNGEIPKDIEVIYARMEPPDEEEEKKEEDDGGKKGKGKKEAKKEKKEGKGKGKKGKGAKGDGEAKQKVEQTGPTEVV